MSVSVLTEPAILPVKRYHPAQVALHWVIAAFIFCAALLAMGQEGEGSRQAAAGIAGIPTLDIYMILALQTNRLVHVFDAAANAPDRFGPAQFQPGHLPRPGGFESGSF